jgi:hypothetical protein
MNHSLSDSLPTMLDQVCREFPDQIQGFLKLAQHGIAPMTEHTTDFSSQVIVVNVLHTFLHTKGTLADFAVGPLQ